MIPIDLRAPEEVCDQASRLLAKYVREQTEAKGRVFDPVALKRASENWWLNALARADGDYAQAARIYEERVHRHVQKRNPA